MPNWDTDGSDFEPIDDEPSNLERLKSLLKEHVALPDGSSKLGALEDQMDDVWRSLSSDEQARARRYAATLLPRNLRELCALEDCSTATGKAHG